MRSADLLLLLLEAYASAGTVNTHQLMGSCRIAGTKLCLCSLTVAYRLVSHGPNNIKGNF